MSNATVTTVPKLLVSKSGVDRNGTNWVMIEKNDGDFILSAFIKTTKPMNVGDELKLPSSVRIPWSL